MPTFAQLLAGWFAACTLFWQRIQGQEEECAGYAERDPAGWPGP